MQKDSSTPEEPKIPKGTRDGQRRRAKGFCWKCNNLPLPGRTSCARHLAEQAAKYQKRRAKGLCSFCEKPALPERTCCAEHLEMRRQQVRERRQRTTQALGNTVCSMCLIRPPRKNLKTCQLCIDRTKEIAEKRARDGKCQSCDMPPAPNRRRCSECLKRNVLMMKERRCDGKWSATLVRDGHQCRLCGTTEKLVVHHIDGSGDAGLGLANNALENLVTLCGRCHVCLETLLYRYKDRELFFRLAQRLPLDQPRE